MRLLIASEYWFHICPQRSSRVSDLLAPAQGCTAINASSMGTMCARQGSMLSLGYAAIVYVYSVPYVRVLLCLVCQATLRAFVSPCFGFAKTSLHENWVHESARPDGVHGYLHPYGRAKNSSQRSHHIQNASTKIVDSPKVELCPYLAHVVTHKSCIVRVL
jgi:hypothetical protein